MPLSVYAKVPINWGAIYFYRFLQPLTFMQKAGLATPYVDFGDPAVDDHTRAMAMAYTDIHWCYQDANPIFQHFLEDSLRAGPYWRTRDEWAPPVNMVIDADDDIFNVSPHNKPAFAKMGTRYMGAELERGFKITADGLDGEKVTLWEDGKNINLAHNRNILAQYRHNLSIASLVTCSTEAMAATIMREAPSATTIVSPNCIDLEDYPKIELGSHDPTIRILWQGGDSHFEDMYTIKDAITRILKKYPNVEIVIWGAGYKSEDWPASQVRHEPWRPYQEYKLRLNQMNHDINLAPLVKNTFNEAKSAIKIYESAACYKPAPTLAARVGPYTEFTDGLNALLYDTIEEFETKLEVLITDAYLRRTIASNCKDWVATNRDPMKWAHKLAEQFTALREGRRAATKPPAPPKEPTDAEHPVSANIA